MIPSFAAAKAELTMALEAIIDGKYGAAAKVFEEVTAKFCPAVQRELMHWFLYRCRSSI